MLKDDRLSGVFAPVVTPFEANLSPNPDLLIAHCRWLLNQSVGLAVFGTNSEANSLSVAERIALMEHLIAANIDPSRMLPGTGCCSITDSVELTRRAVELSCAGVLMLPPFYYKSVSDEGIFASYSEVIQRVGCSNLRVYVYNIPQVSGIALSVELLERLVNTYPQTIVGIKDSAGDWRFTEEILSRGWPEFRVFAGTEEVLLKTMQHGGAGCISATANVNPGPIAGLFRNWRGSDAITVQQNLNSIRSTVSAYPMIPALKAIIAHFSGVHSWRHVRPPLRELSDDSASSLMDALSEMNFRMAELDVLEC